MRGGWPGENPDWEKISTAQGRGVTKMWHPTQTQAWVPHGRVTLLKMLKLSQKMELKGPAAQPCGSVSVIRCGRRPAPRPPGSGDSVGQKHPEACGRGQLRPALPVAPVLLTFLHKIHAQDTDPAQVRSKCPSQTLAQ